MRELTIFSDENFGEVRTSLSPIGEPLFCLTDVCKSLGLLNPTSVCKNLNDDQRCKLNLGRQGEVWFVNESGLYDVIFDSRKEKAKQFRKWVVGDVLPSIRKTGKYEVAKPAPDINDPNYLTNRIMVAKFALEALNMNEVSKLAIVKSISKGYDLPLPEYAPSKGVLKCTTYLLKKIGADCSTRQFNEALIQMGMVQQNQRATPRGMKYFKSLTSDGLEFGENMVSPENPRETQIMLYEDKFSDLFEMYLDHIKF